jgi:hypothetical protein
MHGAPPHWRCRRVERLPESCVPVAAKLLLRTGGMTMRDDNIKDVKGFVTVQYETASGTWMRC